MAWHDVDFVCVAAGQLQLAGAAAQTQGRLSRQLLFHQYLSEKGVCSHLSGSKHAAALSCVRFAQAHVLLTDSVAQVASWPRQQLSLKRKLGSLSPHKAFRGSRLPGSPHHCWARPSAQATLHTAPSRLPAAGTKPVEVRLGTRSPVSDPGKRILAHYC